MDNTLGVPVIASDLSKSTIPLTSRTYRGFNTVGDNSGIYALYDLSLVKQDLLNHFNIRKGEKLENPTFGTIIWDMLFEPLTEEAKALIEQDVTTILNYDPRIQVNDIILLEVSSGIIIECNVTYRPYNVSETLRFNFDQDNGLT